MKTYLNVNDSFKSDKEYIVLLNGTKKVQLKEIKSQKVFLVNKNDFLRDYIVK